jgi:hypothetical protein
MGFNRYKQRFTAWIACFAILMAALAPSISHAVAASGNKSFSPSSEICTAHGSKSLKAAGKPLHNSAPAEHRTHFEHCPFCFTHSPSFGLPPSGEIVIPLATGSPVLPFLFNHSPRPLFAWAAVQPRAPPVHS